MSDPLIAVCVGHSRSGDNGAISVSGQSEHEFNSGMAVLVHQELAAKGVDSFVLDKYEGNGYTAAMSWVARHLKEKGATGAIEIHFNSAGPTATGSEWLYWHSSKNGKDLANHIMASFYEKIPPSEIPSRGIKPLDSSSRGAEFVRRTFCPAVICEQFFGSNVGDWDFATKNKALIASGIASGIADWIYKEKR